ncbi:MAG: hypothetical protein ACRYG8_38570 [Janthinobacterium lividum]
MRILKLLMVGGAGLALTGCVAAVPVTAPTYTVIPGQNKTEADLRADDAICRGGAPVATGVGAPAGTIAAAVPVTEQQYYGCMASRGEAVIQQQVQAYPVYAGGAPYAYPAYGAYPYGYGYPYGGYGYPYGGGYFGPYVGFGIGFGYGGFYGGRGYGGYYRGYGHGGYGHGGYGGYHGGFRR